MQVYDLLILLGGESDAAEVSTIMHTTKMLSVEGSLGRNDRCYGNRFMNPGLFQTGNRSLKELAKIWKGDWPFWKEKRSPAVSTEITMLRISFEGGYGSHGRWTAYQSADKCGSETDVLALVCCLSHKAVRPMDVRGVRQLFQWATTRRTSLSGTNILLRDWSLLVF